MITVSQIITVSLPASCALVALWTGSCEGIVGCFFPPRLPYFNSAEVFVSLHVSFYSRFLVKICRRITSVNLKEARF